MILPKCKCKPYGTRAAMCSPRPCAGPTLGRVSRQRHAALRGMGQFIFRRRVRLGVTDDAYYPMLPSVPVPDNPPLYTGGPTGQVTYVSPSLFAPAVAAAPVPVAVPNVVGAMTTGSWFSGATAGIPNTLLLGGFGLIVGTSLLKNRNRSR